MDDVMDLLEVVGTASGGVACCTSPGQMLESFRPLLLLLADAEGNVIAADDLQSGTGPDVAGRLASELVGRFAGEKTCRWEAATEAGPGVALAVRLPRGPGGGFLACLLSCGDADEKRLDETETAAAVCAAFAWAADYNQADDARLRTRVRHLVTEHQMLKASHAEATAAAIEEREQRLCKQREHLAMEELCRATEAANHAKSQFLANMSHELRTPLHGVLSFAAFGIKKAGTAARQDLLRYFEKIDHSANVLMTLVNDLLDLAKLESGKMTFEFTRTDLRSLILMVGDEFSSTVSARNIKVAVSPSDFDTRIIADPNKIMQVVRNLLSNAVKFSPDGGRIEVGLNRDDTSISVSVRDQGPGIPEDELDAIFDKFIQSSKTRTGAGGTGLGLSICEEIVAAHQGRVWAENNPRGGAALTFELPLDPHSTETERDHGKANSDR